MHRYGLYDVDCREMNEDRTGLTYRPRVEPIIPKLERLYALLETRDYRFVFSTCCSGRMPKPGELPDVLHIPLAGDDDAWKTQLKDYRRFYMAKAAFGDPKINGEKLAFNMFKYNNNATEFFKMMDVETWVVFGNGFNLCVGTAVDGLLAAGKKILLIKDVRISSHMATYESEVKTLASMRERGVEVTTLDEFLTYA